MEFSVSSPLLDGCVLAVLSRGDAYGYALTQELRRWLSISESTLYPVLRRLQQSGCLRVYDKPFQGRNRRYYAITPPGRAKLRDIRRQWQDHRSNVDAILSMGEGVSIRE